MNEMEKACKESILRYIKNEKDISRYKVSKIESRKSLTPSQRRILSIEREFVSLPLEEMRFEDVADVAAAISIYRNSRVSFYKTYDILRTVYADREKLASMVGAKLNFIRDTGLELMTTRVQELNPVQSSEFYFDLVKRQAIKNDTSIDLEKRSLDLMTIDMLLEIEPSTISKKRARTQAAIYSIGKYLYEESLKIKIDGSFTLKNIKSASAEIDLIVDNIKFNIFRYYNLALKTLPTSLAQTMGRNPYLSKLHELQNVLNFDQVAVQECEPISKHSSYDSGEPKLGNISFGLKKAISLTLEKDSGRKVKNRVYGILLPIPRKGSEKMSLLYKDIVVDGISIGPMFFDSISNVKAINKDSEEEYFKALLMQPLWMLVDLASSDISSKEMLSKLLLIEKDDFGNINFNDKDTISKINNTHTGFLEISKNSVVLVPKTRSEEEGLSEIFPILHSRISEIKEDYHRLVANNEVFID
jgi:hypothetical protein